MLVGHTAAIASLRREIHAHPELNFEEVRTAELVARKLGEWGTPMHRGMAGTGVIGIVHGRDGGAEPGKSNRAIGLRADMDALPIQGHNRFAHASTQPGKMHACGHDGHTAMLLAAAQHFAKQRDFDGTVYLIFQPAEEGGGSARLMVDEGLFQRFPMEAVFGMHNWPGHPVGTLAVSPGPVMAPANTFRIVVHGVGGHAAAPHRGIDPVPVACQLVMALQNIVSRNCRPIDAAVLSVTMPHAGEATNVVPDHCEIQGTVRTFRSEVLDLIELRMAEVSRHTCAAGARCDFEFQRRAPTTVNHRREAEFARRVMADIVGEVEALSQQPAMASEDFSFMLQAKADAYCFIGNGDGEYRASGQGEGQCMLHNPSYDFNDTLIPLGATYWVRLAKAWLGAPPP